MNWPSIDIGRLGLPHSSHAGKLFCIVHKHLTAANNIGGWKKVKLNTVILRVRRMQNTIIFVPGNCCISLTTSSMQAQFRVFQKDRQRGVLLPVFYNR